MNGTDVLLLVRTAEGPDVFTAVGSQRGLTREESVAEVDVSSKDSAAMRVIGGRYGATLSLDALYVPDDTAFLALKTAFRDRDLVRVRISEAGTAVEQADALITGMSETYPDQDAATITVGLRVDGEWTAVP